jgi:hypothetical protein
MRKAIVIVALIGAFGNRIPGQTAAQQGPLVITSDYYAQPRTLVVHALNTSGRDITGYTFLIRHKNPDGTVDKGGWSSSSSDMLNVLITAQMAKDPAASESIRQQNTGNEALYAAGNGIFKAGETRDLTMNGMDSGSEFDITAGAVFYADGSFDRQDEDTSKQLLAMRQGPLLAMKKANEVNKGALADKGNEHPAATAMADLTKYVVEIATKQYGPFDPEMNERMLLENDIKYLRGMQRPQKGTTERERLIKYVEEQDKRIELMTPHCHLEIAPK